MTATMKHRRSSSKRGSARGADRYDKLLKKIKKMKKYGGSFFVKIAGKNVITLPHRVTKDNPEYKGVKVISTKKK
jgi:ribosomal protein S19